jgi:NADH:ubiquinone oxidoreductase subunit H
MVLETILYLIAYPPLWQVLILGFVGALLVAMVAIWFERKAVARVQRRIGPYWASPRLGGFMMIVADLIRYLTFLHLNPLTTASRDWVYCTRCHNKVYRYRLWLQARKIAILRD